MNVDSIKSMGRPKGLPFRIGKIGHVGMYVKDLERSTRFYTEILGFQVSDAIAPGELPGGAVFLRCATDHHAIALFVATEDHPAGTGLHHVAMEVPTLDEIVRIREHLREHQIPINLDGRRNDHLRGWRWMSNDAVNFTSSLAGAALAAALCAI